jgi:hypothetical protein
MCWHIAARGSTDQRHERDWSYACRSPRELAMMNRAMVRMNLHKKSWASYSVHLRIRISLVLPFVLRKKQLNFINFKRDLMLECGVL